MRHKWIQWFANRNVRLKIFKMFLFGNVLIVKYLHVTWTGQNLSSSSQMNGKNRAKVTFPLTIQSYGDIFCQVTDFVEKTSLSVFVQNLQISDTVMQCSPPAPVNGTKLWTPNKNPNSDHSTFNSSLPLNFSISIWSFAFTRIKIDILQRVRPCMSS